MHTEQKSMHAGPITGATEWSPADLGLSAVDLKAQAVNTGKPIQVYGYSNFMLVLEYVLAGAAATVGTAVVKIEALAQDDTVLLDAQTILTLVSTEAAGTRRTTVVWGDTARAKFGTGTEGAQTVFDLLKALKKIRVTLDVTTAYNNGGAASASICLVGTP